MQQPIRMVVARLFIYGNHDYGGTSAGSIRGLGLAEAWQQTFGETYTPVWRKEVCGYTFVGAHWTTGGCKGYDEVGIPEGATWITQNGALVRDFRPCLKNGRAGLYDEVSGWIFFPQGGELAYPNEKPDRFVKWANAPGANYVPVAVRAKSGVRAEMKFRPEGTALDQYFLAARNSSTTDTRFLLNYLYRKSASNNSIAIGYKNKWNWRSWSSWAVNTDYTLLAEIANNGSVSGTLAGTYTTAGTNAGNPTSFDTGLDLYMFAVNMGGNAQDYYTGRFSYTTIDVYDVTAGTYKPVRDFKPCVKDGNVMFYDKVSHTMFKPYPAIPADGNVGKDGLTIVLK